MIVTRGFTGRSRQPQQTRERIPPGQSVTSDFPVLTAGPTQHTPLDAWTLSLQAGGTLIASWSWPEFLALPQSEMRTDIHCVTKWSKLDTRWRGVMIDDLFTAAGLDAPPTQFVMAHCDGGYTTNLPIADLLDRRAMVATHYEGAPIPPTHGGPARLLVPHLYLWKSAKWVRSLAFQTENTPGFWESFGYHIYGDPWREQRYSGDR